MEKLSEVTVMRENKYSAIINLSGVTEPLSPLADHRPIAALPFACRYRIIDFLLSSLSYAGVESAALFIDESGRAVYDHVRSGKEWDFDSTIKGGLFTFSQQIWKRFDYIHQEKTEDFYIDHREFLDNSDEAYVVVMGGEIIQLIDVEAIMKQHLVREADITVTYQVRNHPALHSLILNDLGYVTEISDEPGDISLTEVYFLKRDLVQEILDRANADRYYDNLSLVIKKYMLDYKVSGFEYTGFMEPITNIQEYFDVSMKLLNLDRFNALFHSSIPVSTKSQSGAPTYYCENAVVKNAQIATNAVIEGRVENSLIFRKVTVEANTNISNTIIMSGCTVGEGAQLEYVILDKGVVIDPGVILKGEKDNILVVKKKRHIRKEDA